MDLVETQLARASLFSVPCQFFFLSPAITAMNAGFQTLHFPLKCLCLNACSPSFTFSSILKNGVFFKLLLHFAPLLIFGYETNIFTALASVAMK